MCCWHSTVKPRTPQPLPQKDDEVQVLTVCTEKWPPWPTPMSGLQIALLQRLLPRTANPASLSQLWTTNHPSFFIYCNNPAFWSCCRQWLPPRQLNVINMLRPDHVIPASCLCLCLSFLHCLLPQSGLSLEQQEHHQAPDPTIHYMWLYLTGQKDTQDHKLNIFCFELLH